MDKDITNDQEQNTITVKDGDETSLTSSLFSKDAIREIIFSILFGMILPSADTTTDLRLGIRLILNGHPKWGIAILTPVAINTLFTIVSCRQIERKSSKGRWFKYLLLVFLQLYPQYSKSTSKFGLRPFINCTQEDNRPIPFLLFLFLLSLILQLRN